MQFIRVATILAMATFAAASATAPKKHDIQTTAKVTATYDQTWTAVIDLFSERQWPIENMAKDSGLITTDWLRLGSEGDRYADCGNKAPLADDRETLVRFNVRVKEEDGATSVAVNAALRRIRSNGTIDCYSTGVVEEIIHSEIEERAPRVRSVAPVPTVAAVQPRGFYCASSPSAAAAGICARAKVDCVRARDAALALIADMTECTLVETAQCFSVDGTERCAPSFEACQAQRQRAGATDDCGEVR